MVVTSGAFVLSAKPVGADDPAPHPATAQYEIRFLESLIDHHMMAVLTAQLCEDLALHEDLLMLCQQIEAAQTAEIEEMQTWLEDWYGISYEPEMTRQMQRQIEELGSLSGADFEIAFMTMMISHHETAVTEGDRCAERAYHQDLIELCEDIVVTQSMEIAVMEDWLCDWYDICSEK
jgi:uncharacterized protein (DUF305 family)